MFNVLRLNFAISFAVSIGVKISDSFQKCFVSHFPTFHSKVWLNFCKIELSNPVRQILKWSWMLLKANVVLRDFPFGSPGCYEWIRSWVILSVDTSPQIDELGGIQKILLQRLFPFWKCCRSEMCWSLKLHVFIRNDIETKKSHCKRNEVIVLFREFWVVFCLAI